ncbi:CC0125/CC1285 family lipoprotein [Variovorax sp. GB1P17]|uniref:CC0125/CC1285 family lipoprotein n=1 Tax=Variovorax sp. GB1P17 TaxID=3443740 RepID=UPI003F4469E4
MGGGITRRAFRCAILSVLALGALVACGTTPYGPRGLTGGYVETRVADDTYVVAFHGNGKTSGDMVWRYWIYRCAELTRQKGYELFTLAPDKAATQPTGNGLTLMTLEAAQGDPPTPPDLLKGGGGSSGGSTRSVYIPSYAGGGGTITSWHASATIKMFRNASEAGATYALRASAVLDILKPYVASQGRSGAPSRQDLIERTVATPLPEAAGSASAKRQEPVQMKDLDGLIHP